MALLLATALSGALATPVRAQTAVERETARALFDAGKSKRDKGDLAGALESFKGADAIMHAPTTGLAVARSFAALGRLVEARDASVQVDQLPVKPRESQAFADARAAARKLASELAPRIPTLSVVLKGAPEGVETRVTVDGVFVPRAAMSAPRSLDPGKHVVVAALGGGEVKGEITLAPLEAKSIELDVTDLANPRSKEAGKEEPDAKPAPGAEQKGSYSPVLWTGVGLAVVGVAVGSVAGLMSMNKTSDVEAGCKGFKCPAAAQGALEDARTFATISTIGFVAAGVGAGVALIGFGMGRGPSSPRKGSIYPWIGVGGFGATGTF